MTAPDVDALLKEAARVREWVGLTIYPDDPPEAINHAVAKVLDDLAAALRALGEPKGGPHPHPARDMSPDSTGRAGGTLSEKDSTLGEPKEGA